MQYDVAVTAIIRRDDGRFLITRRALNKKRFPGQWTVPGGKLEPQDYENRPMDTHECWYNVLEDTVEREVLEEVGVMIANVSYLTSIVGASGFLCVSCTADFLAGDVVLQADEAIEYAWVTADEARKYDLIDGIYEELLMAEQRATGYYQPQWQRTSKVSSTSSSA